MYGQDEFDIDENEDNENMIDAAEVNDIGENYSRREIFVKMFVKLFKYVCSIKMNCKWNLF